MKHRQATIKVHTASGLVWKRFSYCEFESTEEAINIYGEDTILTFITYAVLQRRRAQERARILAKKKEK